MLGSSLVPILLLPLALCGPNDSLDQLVNALTNVRAEDQVQGAAVITDMGEVPAWLSGTLVRHACGVFGEMENPSSEFVNRVTHIFDCLNMGQSYHFHQVCRTRQSILGSVSYSLYFKPDESDMP